MEATMVAQVEELSDSSPEYIESQGTLMLPEEVDNYFHEMMRYRDQRRGILVVTCQRESVNASDRQRWKEVSQSRRAERYQKHGMEDPKPRFSTATFREFPLILGDNPGGITGPPLSIDWEFGKEITLDLDEYEASRPPRRSHIEMIMPKALRVDILKRNGYTWKQIIAGTKPVNICRSQRRSTQETMGLESVSFLLEKITRKTKNVITLGSLKRSERKFLEPFVDIAQTKGDRPDSPARTIESSYHDLSDNECSTAFAGERIYV